MATLDFFQNGFKFDGAFTNLSGLQVHTPSCFSWAFRSPDRCCPTRWQPPIGTYYTQEIQLSTFFLAIFTVIFDVLNNPIVVDYSPLTHLDRVEVQFVAVKLTWSMVKHNPDWIGEQPVLVNTLKVTPLYQTSF